MRPLYSSPPTCLPPVPTSGFETAWPQARPGRPSVWLFRRLLNAFAQRQFAQQFEQGEDVLDLVAPEADHRLPGGIPFFLAVAVRGAGEEADVLGGGQQAGAVLRPELLDALQQLRRGRRSRVAGLSVRQRGASRTP